MDLERNNPLDYWVKSVSRGKSHMPRKYERKMIQLYQNATSEQERQDAFKELLAYNAASLASIAVSVYYSTRGADWMDLRDLLQQSVLAFRHKLDTFSLEYGTRLITYYTRDIRTILQRYVVDNAMDIRQGSVYLQGIAAKIASVHRELANQHLHLTELQASDIAERLGISERTVNRVRQFTGVTIIGLTEDTLESNYSQQWQAPVLLDRIVELFCRKVYAVHETEELADTSNCVHLVSTLQRGKPLDPDVLSALKQL